MSDSNNQNIHDREMLESLINSMGDGVIGLSETGKIQLYNGAALNILDSHGDIKDKRFGEVCSILDKTKSAIDATDLITSQQKQFVSRDYLMKYPDGSTINIYLSVAPVGKEFGSKSSKGYVVLLRDITREKSLEEERDEFISVVSHELRTPITIAEGNLSNAEFTVSKAGGSKQIQDALHDAYQQIQFLSGMINDLSTLSRAERGKLSAEIKPFNAHDLLLELDKEYKPQARLKGLDFHITTDAHLELINTSELYIREILQNFITNAIKYTEKGSVSLAARPCKNGILFEISDTGIGISKPDQAKIFDKFFRSEDYRTRANSGTGLGLYVTMKLAKLVKAEISLKSELDQGSTFSIFVPTLK